MRRTSTSFRRCWSHWRRWATVPNRLRSCSPAGASSHVDQSLLCRITGMAVRWTLPRKRRTGAGRVHGAINRPPSFVGSHSLVWIVGLLTESTATSGTGDITKNAHLRPPRGERWSRGVLTPHCRYRGRIRHHRRRCVRARPILLRRVAARKVMTDMRSASPAAHRMARSASDPDPLYEGSTAWPWDGSCRRPDGHPTERVTSPRSAML